MYTTCINMVWGWARRSLLLHRLVDDEQYSIIQLAGVRRTNIKLAELAMILPVKNLNKLRYRVVPMKIFSLQKFHKTKFRSMVHDTFTRYSSDTCYSPQGILIWQYSTSGGSSRPSLYKPSTPPITSSKHTTAWRTGALLRYVSTYVKDLLLINFYW